MNAVDLFKRHVPWLLIAFAVGYTAYFWSNPHGFKLNYGPDSLGYLQFEPYRTAGYPVFLDLVIAAFGTVAAVPKAQVVLSAAALAFLGWCIHRAFRASLLALIPICVPFIRGELAQYQAMIMTESLFVSLLCAMAGTLILLIARPTYRLAAASALACGLAIAVRPAGLSLLPIWPIVLWFIWRRCAGRRRMVAAVVAPIALCFATESLLWRTEHGLGLRPSLAGRHLYQKALIMAPDPIIPDDALGSFAVEDRALFAPARVLIANAPDFQTLILLLKNFERAADSMVARRCITWNEKKYVFRAANYQIVRRVGWASVMASPLAWATNALAHYWGYWTAYSSYDLDFIHRFYAYIKPLDEYPHLKSVDLPKKRVGPNRRWLMAALLLASLLALGLASWQRLRGDSRMPDGRLVVACLCGLMIHGHLLAISLFGFVHMRYAFSMWPLMVLCCVLLLDWIPKSRVWKTRVTRGVD